MDVSTPASYRTADSEVDTLDITAKVQQLVPSHVSPMPDKQVCKGFAILTQGEDDISCWLCREGHAMYRCPYLTYEQQTLTAYRVSNTAQRRTQTWGVF